VEVYEFKASSRWEMVGDAIENRGGYQQKMIFAKDGNWLVIGDWEDMSNRGAIYIYQYLKIKEKKVWRLQGGDAIVRGKSPPRAVGWDVDISSDGSVLLYSQNGLVKVLRRKDEEWIDSEEFGDDVGLRPEVELSANGNLLVFSTPLVNLEGTRYRGETKIYKWE